MEQNQLRSCIQACYDCAQACDKCSAACLQEGDVAMMARCIELDDECAAICRLSAQFMGRNSDHARELCQLCAVICDACAEECSSHQAQHCQDCAAACRSCAEECRRMENTVWPSGAPVGALAGTH